MTLTLVLVLFLIAAIIFAMDAAFGGLAPYAAYSGRAQALAFALCCVAFLLWHGGK